ncbi:UDP-N-acetylglucosamine 2-epimerase (non-hydrolyzing) [Patescibacteria group bacterium]|nr:UDP-N-acetylglucosamine 2-epimerase (non-hydrolyzing) [Patescibacteria group bacterium]MBU1448558.1 UDP-N-acetylglucosamine 2-epimerase (non-hydrolyzing) [Patescibacteria group bacterium]
MKDVFLLAGARPNFIKIAPLDAALRRRGISTTLVHTGQHYDAKMSDVFFRDLGIPEPHVHLGIGPGDRHAQTKRIMDALVPLLRERKPDALLVVGDVTSTAAGAMAGVAAGVHVIHVEAGLRSFNWRMPEELNRMIADHHASLLFASEPVALEHLSAERIPSEKVHLVGNVMIDSLRRIEPVAAASDMLARLGLSEKTYGVLTLHRPENVDDPVVFRNLWETIHIVADRLPLVFPVHPRTKSRIESLGLASHADVRMIDPVGYVEMIALLRSAKGILTDSGGLQEEAYGLNIPCLTLRGETERPLTVEQGTSEIVGTSRDRIMDAFDRLMSGAWKTPTPYELWDGHTAERIADIIERTVFPPMTDTP